MPWWATLALAVSLNACGDAANRVWRVSAP